MKLGWQCSNAQIWTLLGWNDWPAADENNSGIFVSNFLNEFWPFFHFHSSFWDVPKLYMSVLYSFCVPGNSQSSKFQGCLERTNSFSVCGVLLLGHPDTVPDDPDRTFRSLAPSPEYISELDSQSAVESPSTPDVDSEVGSDSALSLKKVPFGGTCPYSTAVECSFGGKVSFDPMLSCLGP